ncbi:hypothetical protein LINPERPRIM_LOCUS29701 [Linum perenne]
MNFSGYFMIWLAVTYRIPKPKIWHMCLYICAGANSQSFANTGVLVTCVKNFPDSRGSVWGYSKGLLDSAAQFSPKFTTLSTVTETLRL